MPLKPHPTDPEKMVYVSREYKLPKPWVGLTDEEIHMTTVLLGFNPEWKTEIGMTRAIVRNLEAKLKEKNT